MVPYTQARVGGVLITVGVAIALGVSAIAFLFGGKLGPAAQCADLGYRGGAPSSEHWILSESRMAFLPPGASCVYKSLNSGASQVITVVSTPELVAAILALAFVVMGVILLIFVRKTHPHFTGEAVS